MYYLTLVRRKRALSVFIALVSTMFFQASAPVYAQQTGAAHQSHPDNSATPASDEATLVKQLHELQNKVAQLETALRQNHQTASSSQPAGAGGQAMGMMDDDMSEMGAMQAGQGTMAKGGMGNMQSGQGMSGAGMTGRRAMGMKDTGKTSTVQSRQRVSGMGAMGAGGNANAAMISRVDKMMGMMEHMVGMMDRMVGVMDRMSGGPSQPGQGMQGGGMGMMDDDTSEMSPMQPGQGAQPMGGDM